MDGHPLDIRGVSAGTRPPWQALFRYHWPAYRPQALALEYLWPRTSWGLSLTDFVEGTRAVRFPLVPGALEILH